MTVLNRLQMAWRVAQDLSDFDLVNLGRGLPLKCADYLDPESGVFIHTENGLIGAGPRPSATEISDPDIVNAGSDRVTLVQGGCVVDSVASFALVRGGHVDVSVLGAFEVSAVGDLANWDLRSPDRGPLVGGAMDLAVGARHVWVMMEYVTREGRPRILTHCTLPLTAPRCVRRIYTDLAVIEVTTGGLIVREICAGTTPERLQAATGAMLSIAPDCKVLSAPPLA
jgi:3-oxoadipate CoA-transferase, beta subunit